MAANEVIAFRGPAGRDAGLGYLFDSGTSDADPGEGRLRFNNATPASATALYVDDKDSFGTNVAALLTRIDDFGESTGRAYLRVASAENPANFVEFTVTGSVVDGTGYRKITLTGGVSGGAFTAGENVVLSHVPLPGLTATLAAGLQALLDAKQGLDATLTALAALTDTAFGRSLLELANAAALRLAAELGTAAQAGTGASGHALGFLDVAVTRSAAQLNTAQPAFSAYVAATVSDVTGDATLYTPIPGTEIFDQAANYDPTTGVFTAPLGGRYSLLGWLMLSGVLAGHTTITFTLLTSNRSYVFEPGDIPPDANTRVSVFGAALADMDANDTASLRIQVDGSTKVVDVLGSAAALSGFSGHLVC